jgi:hypothetical protein
VAAVELLLQPDVGSLHCGEEVVVEEEKFV